MIKKLAMIVAVAAVAFSSAAGGGFLLMKQKAEQAEAEQADKEQDLPGRPVPQENPLQELPNPQRDRPTDPADAYRVAAQIEDTRKAVQRRQDLLREQERRFKLVEQDVDTERQVLEGVLVEIRHLVEQVDIKSQDLLQRKSDLDAKLEELKSLQGNEGGDAGEFSEDELSNLKEWSKTVAAMSEQAAATHLTSLINDGKTEEAAKILSFMEDRNAAKVMSELDPGVLETLFPVHMRMAKNNKE